MFFQFIKASGCLLAMRKRADDIASPKNLFVLKLSQLDNFLISLINS
jgi:hypothetical protein